MQLLQIWYFLLALILVLVMFNYLCTYSLINLSFYYLQLTYIISLMKALLDIYLIIF